MQIKTLKINGNEYQFVNETWSTSGSWGHRSVLLKNGTQIGQNKVRYYNRTWESYPYRSCMQGLLNSLITNEVKGHVDNYKVNNNIKRLSSLKRQELESEFKKDNELVILYTNIFYNL